MKHLNLLILFVCLSGNIIAQIIEIPDPGQQVTIVVSGSIYYPDIGPSSDDPISGVVALFVTNGQDGSANTGHFFEGTNYYKPNPDTLIYTSNIGVNKIHLFALDFQRLAPPQVGGAIRGSYNVKVNGVDYVLDTSNVVYLIPCNHVTLGSPSSLLNQSLFNEVLLMQNYPNPFYHSTTIDLFLENRNMVKLDIFDAFGQLVSILVDKQLDAGSHSISWNGIDWNGNTLPPGNYFYQISVGNVKHAKKMLLLSNRIR